MLVSTGLIVCAVLGLLLPTSYAFTSCENLDEGAVGPDSSSVNNGEANRLNNITRSTALPLTDSFGWHHPPSDGRNV
jgi:hypothetical protein